MTNKRTHQLEQRFTELRLRKLSGMITETELKELADIQTQVTAVEKATMEPVLEKLSFQQATVQTTLESLQTENEELVELLNQQSLLISDTKRWLREFDERYSRIRESFTRLTA